MWLRTNFSRIYIETILFAGWIRIPLRAKAFTGEIICKNGNFSNRSGPNKCTQELKKERKVSCLTRILALLLME